MQVFIVEDSSLIRDRLVRMLQATPGVKIAGEAGRATDAIHGILRTRPDVVLCDLHLDEGSGFDVLRAVQAQAPQIDIYVLSAFSTDPYRQVAASLGARDFFDKFSEFERVRDLVAERAASQH